MYSVIINTIKIFVSHKEYVNVDKELIIKSSANEVEIALLEGSKLVEIHRQKQIIHLR